MNKEAFSEIVGAVCGLILIAVLFYVIMAL